MMIELKHRPIFLMLGLVLAGQIETTHAFSFKHLFKHHHRRHTYAYGMASSSRPPAGKSSSPSAPAKGGASMCSADLRGQLHTKTFAVQGRVPESNEDFPVVIVPQSNGESVLAWSDTAQNQIRLARLDTNDEPKKILSPVSGLQVHAGLSDANGTVLAVMSNDPDIYSPKYCQSAQTADKSICGKMDLVKLNPDDTAGFRTTLSSKTNVDREGANFIWWYGHTARIASDGKQYAVYYRTAGSYSRPNAANEVDIHAGDALRFVSTTGQLNSDAGWQWGCSHSWSVRLAYARGQWAAVCHGDAYPNAMQLSLLNNPTGQPIQQQWLNETNATGRALGGLVAAPGSGYWMDYIVAQDSHPSLHLAHFSSTTGKIDKDITIPDAAGLDASPSRYPYRAYLAAYGANHLLIGWKTVDGLKLAVADASTGQLIQSPITTNLKIDDFDEFVATPSGDVVWANSLGDGSVTVNRISACH